MRFKTNTRRHIVRGISGILLLSLLLTSGLLTASASDVLPAAALSAGASGSAQVVAPGSQGGGGQSSAGPGTVVQAQYSNQPVPLSPQQLQSVQANMATSGRTGPLGNTAAAPRQNPGPEMQKPTGPAPLGPAAPAVSNAWDFTVFRNSIIPATGIAGGYGYASYTQEPSSGNNGKNIFQTGNWYASRSFNNGVAWQYLNPFTLFNDTAIPASTFCCDQVTLYDASRDRQFWALQYNGKLKLANSAGASLFSSWCYYNIDATWFGVTADYAIDYNDMAISNNYIYITSNLFSAIHPTLTGILRLPIDALSSCAGFSFWRYSRSDTFTFKLVQGATDTMYWGSNWGSLVPGGNGNGFVVFYWPETSTGYGGFTRSIPAFTFEYRNGGQNCASATRAVTNWCLFADSRVLGGYVNKDVVGFSFNAKQDASFPFPYTRRVIFRRSDLAYLSSYNHWGSWGAIQFFSWAPNARGGLGGVFAWGGGTGTTNYYPGTGLWIEDDCVSTGCGNGVVDTVSYALWGAGNTCLYGGIPRWGDYLTVRRFEPAGYAWLATGYAIKGANCGAAGWYAEPHNFVFGRARDSGSVTRWWNY